MTTNYEAIVERTTERGLFYAWALTLIVACTMGAINGWSRGTWFGMCLLWALFFFIIPVIEFALVHKAVKYMRGRQYLSGTGAVFAALLAFTISVWSTFNTAATNQDGKAAARLAAAEAQESGKDALNVAAGKYNSIKAELEAKRKAASFSTEINGVLVTTPDAARAQIDGFKAHRFYNLSESCSAPKGKQTSAHCANLRAAEAALASASESMTQKEEVKRLEKDFAAADAELKAARATRSAGPVVTDAETPFARKANYYFGVANEDANTIESGLPALGLQLLTMILAVFIGGGAMRSFEVRKTEDQAAEPLPEIGPSFRPATALVPMPAETKIVTRDVVRDVHHRDPRIDQLLQAMKSATAPARQITA